MNTLKLALPTIGLLVMLATSSCTPEIIPFPGETAALTKETALKKGDHIGISPSGDMTGTTDADAIEQAQQTCPLLSISRRIPMSRISP